MITAAYEAQKIARPSSRTHRGEHPLVQHLQHLLASSVVLFLNYKQYSWGSTGNSTRAVQDVFVGFAQTVKGSFDEIAERLRMMGRDPLATLNEIGRLSYVKQSTTGLTDLEMEAEAHANVLVLIGGIRQAIQVARKSGDGGSAAVLTEYLRLQEKHEWILRRILVSSRQRDPIAAGWGESS